MQLVITGMFAEYPVFLIFSLLMGILGAASHVWPYWTDLWRRVWNLQPFTQQVEDVDSDQEHDSSTKYQALDTQIEPTGAEQ